MFILLYFVSGQSLFCFSCLLFIFWGFFLFFFSCAVLKFVLSWLAIFLIYFLAKETKSNTSCVIVHYKLKKQKQKTKKQRETKIVFEEKYGRAVKMEVSKSGFRKQEVAQLSQMSRIKAIQVKNPLVVTMIISDYSLSRTEPDSGKGGKDDKSYVHGGLLRDDQNDDDGEGVKLKDISRSGSTMDHCTITQYLNMRRGYSLVYSSKGGLRIWREVKTKQNVKDKFERVWTWQSIERFNEEIIKELLAAENREKYDGLIYFIGARGTSNGLIYTSKGFEFSLQYIFEKFNNRDCPCLRKLPKLFFIDAERGEIQNTPRKQLASNFSQLSKMGKIGNKSTMSLVNQYHNIQKTQMMTNFTNENGNGNGNGIETQKDETKTHESETKVVVIPDERKIEEQKKNDLLNSNLYNQSDTYIKDGDMFFMYSCPPKYSGGIRPQKYDQCSLFFLRVCKAFGAKDIETLDLLKIINKIKNGIKNECKNLRINQLSAPECVSRIQYKVTFKSRIPIKKK